MKVIGNRADEFAMQIIYLYAEPAESNLRTVCTVGNQVLIVAAG